MHTDSKKHETPTDANNVLCEVNYNAYDTWLEPYIGWHFKIMRVTKNKVLFFMDKGFGEKMICSHDKCLFNLI